MGVEFKFRNPLIVHTGTGVTGSANGIVFTSKEFSAVNEDSITIAIGQAVETTSNVQFNAVTSSGVVSIGSRLFLGDGFVSSSNGVVAHTGSINVTDNIIVPSMSLNGKLTADEVRYENPMKVGPTRNTGDSDTSPLNPPGSPL